MMETKRVSLVPRVGAFCDRKMASKRNIKISDSIGRAPLVQCQIDSPGELVRNL